MMMNSTKVVNPTKVKGLLKGLRYISQIFDEEEKEEEFQIGAPTDVKHVAHIGSDGPSNDAPSWMKDFKSSSPTDSAPVCPDKEDEPDVKWVSEDSKRGNKAANSPRKDTQDAPRSSRRHHSSEGSNGSHSPRKNSSTKTRSSRKQKESSEGSVKSNLSGQANDAPTDAPKKTRRRKSKESTSGHGSTRPRTKAAGAPAQADDDSVKSGPQEVDE